MRIFLAGASGVIGVRLIPLPVRDGHQVAGMTRSPGKAAALRELGADPVVCDVSDVNALARAVTAFGPELVLHPLTDPPDQVERIAEFAARNNRIRAEGTRKGDDLRRWCKMMQVVASTMVSAPKATVSDVYGEYPSWPRLFPTINGVRLLRREGATLVLEIDHTEGTVVNELLVRSPDEISLREVHRRFDALFLNRFETIPGGTRFTVSGEFHLKGFAKLLQPFLRGYARRRMERLQLQPVKAEAEARARRAAEGEQAKKDAPGQ